MLAVMKRKAAELGGGAAAAPAAAGAPSAAEAPIAAKLEMLQPTSVRLRADDGDSGGFALEVRRDVPQQHLVSSELR